MKKILGLTIVALLIMGLVGGGTWAYFSDTESSTGNQLTAGTLDLQLGATQILTSSISNVAPGDSNAESTTLTNNGSIAAELDIAFDTALTEAGGSGGTQYEDSIAHLGGVAMIALYLDAEQDTWDGADDIGFKSDGTTYSYAAPVTGTAESGDTTTLTDSALVQSVDFFNGMILSITGGTNSGLTRLITDFDDTTDTITVTQAFPSAIDATSAYSISNLHYDTISSYVNESWNDVYAGTMANAAVDNFYVAWLIPTSAGNNIQGDQCSFDIDFTLEQVAVD